MSGMPSWAVKGRKVVCVDDSPGRHPHQVPNTKKPTVGPIYVILDTIVDGNFGLCLEVTGADGFWAVDRFKPLITIEDDISTHFAALLDVKQPSPVSA